HAYLYRASLCHALAQMGGWDPSYPVHQDTEYVLKAAASGATFAYQTVMGCIYNKTIGGSSVSRKPLATRHQYWFKINQMVKELIRKRTDLSSAQRRHYLGLCHTNQLISTFYSKSVHIQEAFGPSMLHLNRGSRRLKFLLPILYIQAILRLRFKKQ
ncbi:MAG: hypothetical protein AAGM67_11270, partial [Bacteroidota bacterium]